jgi:hypothetical protein
MITRELWLANIVSVVQQMADINFQKKHWFGGGNIISSPEGDFGDLFDDHFFDEFLESPMINLSAEQKIAGEIFRDKINDYFDKFSVIPEPDIIINDPEWYDVRKSAQDFLNTLTQ